MDQGATHFQKLENYRIDPNSYKWIKEKKDEIGFSPPVTPVLKFSIIRLTVILKMHWLYDGNVFLIKGWRTKFPLVVTTVEFAIIKKFLWKTFLIFFISFAFGVVPFEW